MTERQTGSFFLISPYSDITAPGIRILSAVLRQAGHRVRTLFLQDITLTPESNFHPDFHWQYPEPILEQVAELAEGFDVAGISLMTNQFNHAIQLTDYLRKSTPIPVIWGGVHPTVRPEECLEYADAVCIGEGEETILEITENLCKGKGFTGIENLWIRNGEPPALRSLITDLDALPMPDYDFHDQFVLTPDGKSIKPLDLDLFIHYASGGFMWKSGMSYQIMTSRGCPYQCSFCINSCLRDMYRGQKTYRRRSFEHVFKELDAALEQFPVQDVLFSDDSFFASSEDDLKSFSSEYKKRIGLPFRCMATPNAITEPKVEALMDAGLCYVQVGIQSCAQEILSLYRRKWGSVDHIKRAAQILNKHSHDLEILYDIIIDNPWESVAHNLETLRTIVELPRPYLLQIYSLTLFPGTELFDRAVKEGMIKNEKQEIYQKHYQNREFNYLSVLLSLIHRQYPRWILRLMLSDFLVAIFHRSYMKPLYKLAYGTAKLLRTLQRRLLRHPDPIPEN